MIEIRALTSIDEMNQMYKLEGEIWEGDGAIPVHQTVTAIRNGGLAIGAYDQGKLIGFSYSFPGFLNGKVYLCSHNMGIRPEYRSRGVGAALKTRQKEEAVRLGYDLLTWTYDPLETRNGYLNLSKLRAICSTYIENCYGEVEDGFNSGLPTDRFKVEWWVKSGHVSEVQPTVIKEDACYLPWEASKKGPVLTDAVEPSLQASQILLPVPAHFQHLKMEDMELAIDWRMKTRALFQQLFKEGYAAAALERSKEGPVHHYLLEKRSELNISY